MSTPKISPSIYSPKMKIGGDKEAFTHDLTPNQFQVNSAKQCN